MFVLSIIIAILMLIISIISFIIKNEKLLFTSLVIELILTAFYYALLFYKIHH